MSKKSARKRTSKVGTESRDALIIFLKEPTPGKVKTRIAKSVGEEEAARIYESLLARAIETFSTCYADLHFFCSPRIFPIDAHGRDFKSHLQVGTDLGERMHQSFVEILSNYDKAIIVGTDCPMISLDILEYAFIALDRHDYVLGPAFDGGYYLLGMKEQSSHLFDNMTWSTDQVAEQTRDRMRSKGSTWAEVDTLQDIDRYEDWLAYLKSLL